MVFNSIPFLIFFTIFFLVYWTLPSRFRPYALLLGSYYFYYSWDPIHAVFLFALSLVVFAMGKQIAKTKKHGPWILTLSVSTVLAPLLLFKYTTFFLGMLTSIFPQIPHKESFSLLLPLGVSFYTFQALGYLVDVYRGVKKPESNVLRVLLFMSFFPQLIAGPIARASHVIPQFLRRKDFSYAVTVSGLKLFTFGLFKKVVIADNLAKVVDEAFAHLTDFRGLSLVIIMMVYSWQIYADFSGYTDMARGIARTLGFDLLKNFSAPYLASSVRDFWRRWHQSLSTWFRDYLYIPLGGSKHGLLRTLFNTLIVFTICGLWHGASLNFVLWGAFHGLMLGLERLASFAPKVRPPKLVSTAYVYITVTIFWVLFRAETLADALYIYRNALVGVKNFLLPGYFVATINQLFLTNRLEMLIVAFCLATIVGLEWLNRDGQLGTLLAKKPLLVRWATYTAVATLIVVFRNADIKQFIYVQF